MLITSDVTRQFLPTIIQIIERKTSEEHTPVNMRILLKKLQQTYPFFYDIEIKNTSFLKLESNITLQDWLNIIHPKEVGVALKELTKKIIKSMRKNARYFFIREKQEKIGEDYDTMVVKTKQKYLELQKSHTYIYEQKFIKNENKVINRNDRLKEYTQQSKKIMLQKLSATMTGG
jgi:hypothetical protein